MRTGRPFAPPRKLLAMVAEYLGASRNELKEGRVVPGHSPAELDAVQQLADALAARDKAIADLKDKLKAAKALRAGEAIALWGSFVALRDFGTVFSKRQNPGAGVLWVRKYQHHSHRKPRKKKSEEPPPDPKK